MTSPDFELIAKQVKQGVTPFTTPRELLHQYRYERRGRWIVSRIRRDLEEYGLITVPDFEHASLFRAIDLIVKHEFVLVRKRDRTIGGIVTSADLSESFDELARPFLLLGEIENNLRLLVQGKFTQAQLEEVRDPNDTDRTIEDVTDMTFGDYVRLLQKEDRWERLDLRIDRVTFIKDLDEIRRIRNEVMHFDPDGLGPTDLEKLKTFAQFLQELVQITGPQDSDGRTPASEEVTTAPESVSSK